ncbi:unnamed protein product [Lactuca saligna]|uniref:Uncharacterized protein n=1 Tax=Lactuca saligna TaxID=75948 RepID=A0AA35Z8I7_LACSI|nr:unnamed protein product [Lactuca saligna]
MVAVVDPSKYFQLVQPLIICLDHSILKKALVMIEYVPISQLSLAYSIAIYNKKMEVMGFEIQRMKTSISKTNFCKLSGLSITEDFIAQDNISTLSFIQVHQKMGYISDLSVLSQFKKFALPPIWNALFTIQFKCISKRSIGYDNASQVFHTLLYGLYFGEKIDF